ncbi:MAG TPA: SEC-C metal-binding domain-containing protein [Bacillota bacterium]|nr:SEC-C metal-binding domain-containing protein [Bacillota bacterium]
MPRTVKLCPCGSGKPYETCCRDRDRKAVFSLEQARWRRAAQSLRRSLGLYADQPSFAWDTARAQDLYLGCLDQQLTACEDDFTMERCFEWFIFDYKLSSGKTVLETFREENLHNLDRYQLTLARQWTRARISLYEVTGIIPGEGLLIKEIFGRKEILVRDLNAAAEIDVGSILFMRVLKVGEEYEFSTSGLALPCEYGEQLLERLYRDRQEYYWEKNTEPRGWVTYFKERAHVVNAIVMELGFSSTRNGSTASNEEVERCAILAIDDWLTSLENMQKLDCFRIINILKDSSGVFRQATISILGRPCTQKTCELRPVVGQLLLTPYFAILKANTPREMQESKKILALLDELAAQENSLIPDLGGIDNEEPGLCLTEGPSGSPDREPEKYTWPMPGYAIVAGSVQDGLQALGYTPKQQKGALKLWYDFCSKEHPAIRKTAVWTAAVIYAFARLEMEKGLKQQELAYRYGVSSSTISSRFRLLCQALQLVTFDKRYSTKKPRGGLKANSPLLKGN